jgi:hypothetical protein
LILWGSTSGRFKKVQDVLDKLAEADQVYDGA